MTANSTFALLVLASLAGPAMAQSGAGGGTCVISILDHRAAVQSKGNIRVGQCFGPGQEIVSPAGTVVKVVTPLKDTIAVSGTLRIKEQSDKGQSFWVRSGTAVFNVVAKQLSFFNVEGQNGNRTFQAAVHGTTFEMAVVEGKSVTLTPQEGEILVTRAVKLGIGGADRAEGKGDIAAARTAAGGGAGGRAQEALKPDRSDLLAASYAGKSELVSAGSDAVAYALDKDDVISFDTVEECVASFTAEMASGPTSEGYRNLGDCYLQGDDPRNAVTSYNRALAIDLKLHPDRVHPDIAEDYRGLADAQSLTNPRQAIASLQQALAIDAQYYDDDLDPSIAEDHRMLADLYLLIDAPEEAIAALQKALAIDQRLYPDGVDFDLAEDYRSLGESATLAAIASGSGSRLSDAIAYFGKALAIDQQLYDGEADPDLADDHRGLGYAYLLGDNHDAASASFSEALSIGFRLVDVAYSGNPAAVNLDDLDLDSDDVDIDDVVGLYEDALMLSELAADPARAEAFQSLADDIAALFEGSE